MLYKPKYCCHCGEQIERVEWFPWTSRRFCETCETENKIYDWLPRGLVVFGVVFSLFGLGAYLSGGGEKEPTVTVKQSRAEISKPTQSSANQRVVSQATIEAQPPVQQLSVNNQAKPVLPSPKTEIRQSEYEPKEIAYFCGAQTKKGTPCSRRVKNGGRCWQHAGQPAILPPEKLVASQ